MTAPTLLTPWHDLGRLARAVTEAERLEAEACGSDGPLARQCDIRRQGAAMARIAFRQFVTPERILSLLDAVARGAAVQEEAETGRLYVLRDKLEAMRENGDDDLRTAILYVDEAIKAARAVPPALDGPSVPVSEQNNAEG